MNNIVCFEMTKKELIDSECFNELPDDAEIVFATNGKIRMCVPMNELNLSVLKEDGRTALVIDAIPYWYLKEGYGITLNTGAESEN